MNALLRLYEEHEDAMCDALAKDLNKHRQESIINEVELLRNDVRNLIMNLRSYAQVEYVSIMAIFFSSIKSKKKTEFLNWENCSRRKRSSICWTRWKFTRIHMVLYS